MNRREEEGQRHLGEGGSDEGLLKQIALDESCGTFNPEIS